MADSMLSPAGRTTQNKNLSLGGNTVQARYSHVGKNTLYYLAPDTHSLFLLDFKIQKFVKRSLSAKIPLRATSSQTNDGSIYVMGGMIPDKNLSQHALRDCLHINPDLECHN